LKAYWIVAVSVALVLCAVSVPARADSVTYNYSYNLVSGGSSVGTVTGSFSYNSSTFTMSNATITFNSSLFGNVTLQNLGSHTGFVFAYGGIVGGNFILYVITVNPLNPSQYWVTGTITNLKTGVTASLSNYTQVPEGGDWYAYLIPSLLAVCGGIALAGRQPRNARVLQAG
jgi:hypothetical protein